MIKILDPRVKGGGGQAGKQAGSVRAKCSSKKV